MSAAAAESSLSLTGVAPSGTGSNIEGRGEGENAELLGRGEVAAATIAFRFSRPPGFTFRAGQALDLVLPGDKESLRHAFSIASAPFEEDLLVATRMRESPFKRALAKLAPGARARIEGPFGSLTLHRNPQRDALLVAGGIGITPFLSMAREAAHAGDRRRMTLLYSNRRSQDAAFLGELERLARDRPAFRLVRFTTDGGGRKIDAAAIREAAAGLSDPVCYVAGPPGMVGGMREAFAAARIDEDDVRGEEFFGY